MQKGRTENKWENKYKKDWIKDFFPPRLQRDIRQLDEPGQYPDIDLQEGEGLFLFGPVKSGKTVFAAQLALEIKKQQWLASEYKDILFVSVPKIFSQLKTSFNNDVSESEIISEYQDVDLLILDDIGPGKVSDWFITVLYLIINHRYENLLPTIITSNKNLDELAKILGDHRITSRIERMCMVLEKKPWNQ